MKIAVHCPTKEDWNKITRFLDNTCFVWNINRIKPSRIHFVNSYILLYINENVITHGGGNSIYDCMVYSSDEILFPDSVLIENKEEYTQLMDYFTTLGWRSEIGGSPHCYSAEYWNYPDSMGNTDGFNWKNHQKGLPFPVYKLLFIDSKTKKKMNKQIELSLEKAREIYKQNNPLMNTLLLENFSKEDLEKPLLPTSWNDLPDISGYYIMENGKIGCEEGGVEDTGDAHGIFATEKQVQSALNMAMLSQLMKAYNGDWEADWTDKSDKFVIDRCGNDLKEAVYNTIYHFLTFRTSELRDRFLRNFEELIKRYYML